MAACDGQRSSSSSLPSQRNAQTSILLRLTTFLFLSSLATGCASEIESSIQCGDNCDYLGEFPAITPAPKSVLFIPLNSGYLGLSNQKWQSDDVEFDRAIGEMTTMYRAKGVDEIVTLPRLDSWEELDSSVAEFSGRSFDRVIIVGHGALDGPITRGTVARTIEEGLIVEQWVMQPGLVREYVTKYSEERFGTYIEENHETLLTQYDSVTETLFKQISDAEQVEFSECAINMTTANENICVERSCPSIVLHSKEKSATKTVQKDASISARTTSPTKLPPQPAPP